MKQIAISPALMRFRIKIEYESTSQDAEGIETTTWLTLVDDLPAGVIGLSGRELDAVGQLGSQYNARITIYKRSDIDESMRIVFDGRIYDIIDIIPDPTNELYQSIMSRTGFTNG